jgi:Zn-dependent protease
VDASSISTTASDTADFAATLEILRNYPHKSKHTVAAGNTQFKSPPPVRFSGRRFLKIIAWAFSIFAWLFTFFMLMATRHPSLAMTLLLAGPVALILFLLLRRKQTATSPLPITADAPDLQHCPANNCAAAVESLPARDKFPLQPERQTAERPPASRLKRFLLFSLSLALYAAIALLSLPDLTTTWIVLTVLLHEIGHFVAMYRQGYSNLQMFFIPFIAGAVAGTKANPTPAEQLRMLLAGPAPGLLLGCSIYWLDALQPIPAARTFAIWLVALNLLNLLPVWPLDGGRIVWILFARHSAFTQAVLSACSFVGVFFLLFAPQGGTTFLIVMIVLLLGWLPGRYHDAKAALLFQQQHPDAPAELKQLSEQQLWSLYWLTRPAKPAGNGPGTRAMEMMNIYSRVSLLPRSPAQLRYLLAFVLLWLITLATAAGTSLQLDARDASAATATLFDSFIPG